MNSKNPIDEYSNLIKILIDYKVSKKLLNLSTGGVTWTSAICLSYLAYLLVMVPDDLELIHKTIATSITILTPITLFYATSYFEYASVKNKIHSLDIESIISNPIVDSKLMNELEEALKS